LSLGASRVRLIRQLLTESTLLALLAGGTGLLMSLWLVRLVATMEPPSDLPMSWDVWIDMRVLAFTFLATVITGVLFGLFPALQSTRQNLVDSLKEGSSAAARRSSGARRGLVVFQVALSLVLLIGSALAVRGLQAAGDIDPGFEPDNLLIASVDLDLQGYDEDRGLQFHRQLRERLSATPGVVSVGYGDVVPLNLMSNSSGVVPEGFEVAEGSAPPIVERNMVDHHYFEAMGIPILRGRAFRESDNDEAPPVLMINQAFADRFWPGDNPVGKQVRTWGEDYEVIGVVPTGKYTSLGEDPKPFYYMSMNRFYSGAFFIHVRTAGDPSPMLETVRRQVLELEPTLPVSDLQTMHEALGIAFLPARLAATVVTGFAALALTLAAIGLYGVIAYQVSQGTREIGIRMALGAESGDVLGLVVRQGMILTAIGLVVGVFGGYALARLMAMLIYGISPTDVIAFLVAAMILSAISLLATYLPARRATRVDPMVALRVD
jgi:predicted permease